SWGSTRRCASPTSCSTSTATPAMRRRRSSGGWCGPGSTGGRAGGGSTTTRPIRRPRSTGRRGKRMGGGETMLGYDWPRVHAMLTALPVALLTTAVLCELAALVWRSESLRQTGFVTLVAGTLGAGAAVIAGLQAEDRIDHGPAIHALMEEHQELGLITLGIFAVVAIWRVA